MPRPGAHVRGRLRPWAPPRGDIGHDVYHAQAGGRLACASCHPEGGDDGHVWILDGLPRRTPSQRGKVRFGRCATSGHGSITSLAAQDISDLVAYLDSL